jgi:hypothetical protein
VKILKLLSLIVPCLTVENCLMSVICKMFDRNLVCFILTKILNFFPFSSGWVTTICAKFWTENWFCFICFARGKVTSHPITSNDLASHSESQVRQVIFKTVVDVVVNNVYCRYFGFIVIINQSIQNSALWAISNTFVFWCWKGSKFVNTNR